MREKYKDQTDRAVKSRVEKCRFPDRFFGSFGFSRAEILPDERCRRIAQTERGKKREHNHAQTDDVTGNRFTAESGDDADKRAPTRRCNNKLQNGCRRQVLSISTKAVDQTSNFRPES